ncbi:MAG: flagellar basal body P-ring formation chaperone FlgA [Xanthobacteraceae bacterium]
MTNRFLLPAILGFLALLLTGAYAAGPSTVTPAMKAEATISGDIVRVGDVIENAGPAATIPAFHAPDLGARGTIQTHRVLEIARQNGIDRLDTRGLQEVMIFRAARMIPVSDLEAAVAEAAVRHLGLRGAADVSIRFDRDVRALQVEPDATDAPRVVQFAYDPHVHRFEGIVEVQGSLALRRTPVRLSGTLTETAEIVVVARALSRGEAVRESDILVERRPRTEVAADAVTRPAAVIGQAARRSLRPGQTLRPADLMKPDLVARDDMVTILFEVPGIMLTARGKALGPGAEGETVSVLNSQSKRILQATVQRPGVVVVSRGGAVTADATGTVR